MASGPITSWQIDVETVTDFIFLAPKSLWTVTAAMKLKDACSLVGGKKTKQNTLASWKKSYDQHRQRIKRKRHHFAYKGLYSQSYGFSGSHEQIWEVDHKEGWAMLSNCDAGELLRVHWTARKSNQSILKEISPEYSLEGLRLNSLATWCEKPTHWKRLWWRERLKIGGEWGDRGWDDWMASSTQWTWLWTNSGR